MSDSILAVVSTATPAVTTIGAGWFMYRQNRAKPYRSVFRGALLGAFLLAGQLLIIQTFSAPDASEPDLVLWSCFQYGLVLYVVTVAIGLALGRLSMMRRGAGEAR